MEVERETGDGAMDEEEDGKTRGGEGMATGRKPHLSVVVTEDNHLTKKQKKERAKNEPKGCKAALTTPKQLSKEAKKEWKRIIALYRQLDMEVINDLDVNTLALYCENVAIMQKAERELQTQPLVVIADVDKGTTKPNPLIKIMQDAGNIVIKTAEQLCLSPVGRARVGVMAAKKEEKSDIQKLLEQRRKTN